VTGTPSAEHARIGLVRLTDAAPVILAEAAGYFAAEGVAVTLSIEPSWANLADKLAYGQLDAAVMLPPLALAIGAGIRPAATPLVVPMSISLGGNSITLATALAEPILEGGRPDAAMAGQRLRALLPNRPRPRLAVVHGWSTHDLLLRYWLSASGIDPDRDVRLTVVPPAAMAEALQSGEIDGFCAGAPWGTVAAAQGFGRTIAFSSGIWHHHPEKCLAVSRRWADTHPAALQALLRAILRAGRRCDDPAATPEIAGYLAEPRYLDLPAATIAASLPGGAGGDVDRSVFHAHAATYPFRSHAAWFLAQAARWREMPAGFDPVVVAETLYRPDLYGLAAAALGIPVPLETSKIEGGHSAPWRLPATPEPIRMEPDTFFDGAVFVP